MQERLGQQRALTGTAIAADATTNNQSAVAGTTLTQAVKVIVTDQDGDSASRRDGDVDGRERRADHEPSRSSVTDVTGAALMQWTLDTIARVDSLRAASIAAGTSLAITATGTADTAANAMKVSGDSQRVAGRLHVGAVRRSG